MFQSINPFDKKILNEYPEFTDSELEKTIAKAQESFETWRKFSYTKRAEFFLNLSKILITNKNEIAKLITLEMGKRLSDSELEIEKCALTMEFYAQNVETFLKTRKITTDFRENYVCFEPLGVILAIMPWNYPFWQVFRFAIPTLMAGNTVILKHASNVSGCALEIEKLFHEAGFPHHVFQTILMNSKKTEYLLSDKRIKAVSLTGSTPAGQSVASLAGRYLKKSVLELGGSDPYIVLEDADLEQAVDLCVKARMGNSGQTCIAAKRFIVSEKIYDIFKSNFVEKLKHYQIGNPLEKQTTLAPMARHDLRDELHRQVLTSIQNGAKVVVGGNIPAHTGAFYEPTLLENITKNNPAYFEEFFGPVALFFKFQSEEEAIEIANGTQFGLGSAIFSKDIERAKYLAQHELQAGSVFINSIVKSDPRLPFGGIKDSGYGRELSDFGIQEFTNIKTLSLP